MAQPNPEKGFDGLVGIWPFTKQGMRIRHVFKLKIPANFSVVKIGKFERIQSIFLIFPLQDKMVIIDYCLTVMM